MLSFLVTYKDKTEKSLKDILTAVIESDTNVPADSLTVTFPYSSEISKNADYISAYLDNKLVFTGQIDEIITIKKADGAINKLTARSMASFLLDNEAEALTYINPSAGFIFERHLKPLGIAEYEADDVPFYGALKIEKGMTHWQVFYNFCKNRYGVMPRISGDGKAYFKGADNSNTVTFGEEKGDIHYVSLRENNKRFKLISEVKLKLNEFGTYSGVIRNTNDESNSINRVRYVNLISDNNTIETADKIINQSNLDSYTTELECLGCHIGIIGHKAEIYDNLLGEMKNLRIIGVRYTLDNSGEKTTVTMGIS